MESLQSTGRISLVAGERVHVQAQLWALLCV